MNNIKLNHWFVDKDELSISLMNFFVKINIVFYEDYIYYELNVIKDSIQCLTINFYSIEAAITFTEDVIDKCSSVEEIVINYERLFNENKNNPDSVYVFKRKLT